MSRSVQARGCQVVQRCKKNHLDVRCGCTGCAAVQGVCRGGASAPLPTHNTPTASTNGQTAPTCNRQCPQNTDSVQCLIAAHAPPAFPGRTPQPHLSHTQTHTHTGCMCRAANPVETTPAFLRTILYLLKVRGFHAIYMSMSKQSNCCPTLTVAVCMHLTSPLMDSDGPNRLGWGEIGLRGGGGVVRAASAPLLSYRDGDPRRADGDPRQADRGGWGGS